MLIKAITKKGQAVPYDANGALPFAVQRAVTAMNTKDTIYWLEKKDLNPTGFHSTADKDGKWEAWAEGTAMIGYTKVASDKFFMPKQYSFQIHYKLGKDSFGIPDIELAEAPVITLVQKNPANMVGNVAITKQPAVEVGELQVREPVAEEARETVEVRPGVLNRKAKR